MDQSDITEQNRIAWEAQSYEAWVSAYGQPDVAAAKLIANPEHKLRRLLPHIDHDIRGNRIANPLGSHGRIATALALLGAEVVVFDLSASNKRYALELAKSAGVRIGYELGDFLTTSKDNKDPFDVVVMELGILHYFIDLNAFVSAVRHLLKPNGRMVLNEFHPVLSKTIQMDGGSLSLKGDYFSSAIVESDTPYGQSLDKPDLPPCLSRQWTLGEIVTAFIEGGFRIQQFVEGPSWNHAQLPGTFTLVADSI